jgi:hypothetical protein
VEIIGDMPIYVGGHSADVWSNQTLFDLGPTGLPANVSGVPPDAFSETGALDSEKLELWRLGNDITRGIVGGEWGVRVQGGGESGVEGEWVEGVMQLKART